MDKAVMNRAADNIRILAAAMVEKARSGHPGGSMGGADFANVLYSQFLVSDPDDPTWPLRDRFFLDPGHMSPMLYGVLAMTGRYTLDELAQFRTWGSVTPGHPELDPSRGVENTSGPLGQGHTMAVGCAIAERFMVARFGEVVGHKTYAFISDGGIQEEISQGAGRLAGHLGLNNLIMFYDANEVQLSTQVSQVDSEDYAAKYRAWGWQVYEIDGTDPEAIADALTKALAEKGKPVLIIGHTIMGRGVVKADGSNFEGQCSTHGQPLSKSGADYEATVRNLGGDPADPFRIFDDVRRLYAERAEQLRAIVAERRKAYAEWAAAEPAKAARFESYFKGVLPDIDYEAIAHKPGVSTRAASSDVLAELGRKCGNMIVSSADLSNSDKTDGFLKQTRELVRGDFGGAFLQAGVAELTMASVMNGIVLHGGMMAACGTFFVFSDYMKPAIRMAALMELPVKYVWSHDSFRVGEDGPTHEPIEQEAQIRLLELMKNFKGQPALLAIRPADAAETSIAWEMAMENTGSPTALILSRQDVPDLPAQGCSRIEAARQAKRGGYTVLAVEQPDIVLVANGSEVSLLCQVAEVLLAEGIRANVVSVPAIALFNEQSEEYKSSVLPAGVPQFGFTAGLPLTLKMIDGFHGPVKGMSRFGASANYKVLEDKFGYTVDDVADDVRRQLGRGQWLHQM